MVKWDILRVFCDFLARPHDKYCICICPKRRWFMFINSDPPAFRKARALAVEVSSFEATFLQHASYIDTTKLMVLDDAAVEAALADPDRSVGRLMSAVRGRIVGMVGSHEVMPEDERLAVLSD